MSAAVHTTASPAAGLPVRWAAADANKVALPLLVVGAIATAATVFGATQDARAGMGPYLTAYMLFLQLALGSLFFVLIHHVTSSRWGVTVRRIAEASMATLPLFAILFVPVVLFLHDLFEWTHQDVVAKDPLLTAKKAFLNEPFFLIRAALYFVVWTIFSQFFWRKSLAQDKGHGAKHAASMKTIAAPGIIFFALSMTFAAFDWLMSLQPHFFSTMFGVYYFAGGIQGAMAVIVLLALFLRRSGLLEKTVTVEHFHDLGKLLFGFTVFFAYIAFSQFFLIWYSNIPEETEWYLHRWGPWAPVSMALIFFCFVFPFFTLLSRHAKRTMPLLATGAVLVLIGRLIDQSWLVLPALEHGGEGAHGFHFTWTYATAILGIGGLYLGTVFFLLGKHPLIPVGDPLLQKSLEHENV